MSKAGKFVVRRTEREGATLHGPIVVDEWVDENDVPLSIYYKSVRVREAMLSRDYLADPEKNWGAIIVMRALDAEGKHIFDQYDIDDINNAEAGIVNKIGEGLGIDPNFPEAHTKELTITDEEMGND